MITLSPISKNIQDTLFQKMAMLSSGGNQTIAKDENGQWVPSKRIVNKKLTEGDGKLVKNYMHARTVWMRMTSFTPRSGTKNTAVVIMGGELGGDILRPLQDNEFAVGRLKSGFYNRTALDPQKTIAGDGKINYQGLYNLEGEIPFRPLGGVKDISVEYKGGGMKLGATRTADINWNCWNFEQLEHFTPHFLQEGKTILLEWGWGGIGALGLDQIMPLFKDGQITFDDDKIENLNIKILDNIQKNYGNYDAMLGIVQSFDWSVNETGGFECNTSIISPGVTIFQSRQKKFKANNFATLPALTQQKDFGQKGLMWLWNDLREVVRDDISTVPKIAPYITFQEYMKDFGQQIAFQLHVRGCTTENFSKDIGDKVNHQIIAPYKLHGWDTYLKKNKEGGFGYEILAKKSEKYFVDNYKLEIRRIKKERSSGADDPDTPEINESFTNFSDGSGFFVTWGWFEDNVLSRFFGNVTETDPNTEGETVPKKIIGQFRSIERKQDLNGEFVEGDDEDKYQNIKFRNNKYLMTADMSKWIIPNINDPVFSMVSNWAWTSIDYMNDKNPEIFFDKDEAAIRKIFFNAKYLSNKLSNSSDIIQSVNSIWDEFSSTYGGIYRFKVEYDDVGNTLCMREEGFTHKGMTVKEQLEEQAKISSGDASDKANAFMFPTWEENSIVRSQTINAKLPDRMKLAAMYGINIPKSKDNEKSNSELDLTITYDDIAAKAWGRFSRPIKGTEGMTPEQMSEKNYKDRITGDIDTPTRGNRYFGRYDADINKPLVIGPNSDNNPGKWNITGNMDEGTVIGESIIYSLEESSKLSVVEEKAGELSLEDESVSVGDKKELTAAYNNYLRQIDVTVGGSKLLNFNRMFYTWIDSKKVSGHVHGYRRLKGEILSQLQSLLRGHGDGVLQNTDPLIPIEFEMEIDGTGGIFPGNSFQSSYLPKRYRQESLFQTIGVSHKISSTEWVTSIKGQIRAMATIYLETKSSEVKLNQKRNDIELPKVVKVIKQEEVRDAAKNQIKNNGIDNNGYVNLSASSKSAKAGEALSNTYTVTTQAGQALEPGSYTQIKTSDGTVRTVKTISH